MGLNLQDVNVIGVVWENHVLIPVALSWKSWPGYSGGREIIIIPPKGIHIQKVKRANATSEKVSSARSKQRQQDHQNWYSDFKSRTSFSYRSPSQKYKLSQANIVKDVSKTNLFGASSRKSSAGYSPIKSLRLRPPYLWSTRETSYSTKAEPALHVDIAGDPATSNDPTKTQLGQKVRSTDSPFSRVPTKTRSSQKSGTVDRPFSRIPTKPPPVQTVGTTGDTSYSQGPRKAQSGQKVGTTDGPSSSSGAMKKQPVQQVGSTVKKPTPNGSTQPKPEFSQFEKECLDEHNKFRATHGALPLTLSRNLCNYAQEWANHLVQIGGMEHRTEGKYGENLFMSSGLKVDARMPVRNWYDEIKFYKYGSEFSPTTGHFTQVVWKGTKELGCAFAQKGNSIYVVANYSPPGNVQGQFSANVLPPKN